ncbi:Spc98 family-domain-containing protein [Amylostereum chailletii]|nr:Spc98 family-domain-containing protein [Amylostereum chailletii]
MDPFTPRPRTGGRKKNLTLSAREYTKVTGTIASVRRNRQRLEDDCEYGPPGGHVAASRPSRKRESEPSFIAEESFVRAPLNSRVVSGVGVPSGKGKTKQERLDNMPLDVQEAVILEDLLFVLMGIEGTHISYHEDYSPDDDDPLEGIRFVASKYLDPSLSDLVERILPLATYYTAITSFVEQRSHLDFGLVNHALCAAIRDMLKDYQTLLSQLEHTYNTSPQFSLQKLWFYVHPTVHTLSLIYQLITELALAGEPSGSGSSSSSEDEDEARNEALGLGGFKLKAVLGDINQDVFDSSSIPVKGGEVLAILHGRMLNMSGDPSARTLYGALLKAAGKPYVYMLRVWTRTGSLNDPYEEMCVKESKFINRGTLEMDYTDEYWERRYTLRDGTPVSGSSKQHQAGVPSPRSVSGRLPGGACIPPLLEGWKRKILLAGKYLNVIRECGIEIQKDATYRDEDLSMDDERFYKSIEEDYTFANKTLLQLLLKDQELVPRLRYLKRHFFLSHSSFLTHFLDLSHSELRKAAKSASLVKLQSLLDMTLSSDPHSDDMTFRDDMKVVMMGSGLYEWLSKVVGEKGDLRGTDSTTPNGDTQPERKDGEKGKEKERKDKDKDKKDKTQLLAIDALSLDFTVKFPLSLVVSRKTILRYQLIFRFLLHLKHLEQTLTTMWIDQTAESWRRRVPDHPEFEQWRRRVFLLRARMLALVQQILAFITFEVLEPKWRDLEVKLAKVITVDQLLRDHVDFLDSCIEGCMMTNQKMVDRTSKMLAMCTAFTVYTSSLTKAANVALSTLGTPEGDQGMAKRWEILQKFEVHFSHHLQVYSDRVQVEASSETASLLPLVGRLNSVKN